MLAAPFVYHPNLSIHTLDTKTQHLIILNDDIGHILCLGGIPVQYNRIIPDNWVSLLDDVDVDGKALLVKHSVMHVRSWISLTQLLEPVFKGAKIVSPTVSTTTVDSKSMAILHEINWDEYKERRNKMAANTDVPKVDDDDLCGEASKICDCKANADIATSIMLERKNSSCKRGDVVSLTFASKLSTQLLFFYDGAKFIPSGPNSSAPPEFKVPTEFPIHYWDNIQHRRSCGSAFHFDISMVVSVGELKKLNSYTEYTTIDHRAIGNEVLAYALIKLKSGDHWHIFIETNSMSEAANMVTKFKETGRCNTMSARLSFNNDQIEGGLARADLPRSKELVSRSILLIDL
jgi:hypothetical protein